MSFIKKYQRFVEEFVLSAQPQVVPDITETPAPTKPSPFRRDKPAVEPGTKASADQVANRFIQLVIDRGETIEKYIK